VKYLPDATADRQFAPDNTVDPVGVDELVSELDEEGIEQSLRIKEKPGTPCFVSEPPQTISEVTTRWPRRSPPEPNSGRRSCL